MAPAVSSCVRVWSASVRTKRSLVQPVQTELSPVEALCVQGKERGGVCMWERGGMCKGKTKEIEVIR